MVERVTLAAVVLLIGQLSSAAGAGWSPKDRDGCKPGATPSPLRVNTTQRLSGLRAAMVNNMYVGSDRLQGYIIPSVDAHQSEYTSNYDKRRQYICGLSGSAGIAVVTTNEAAVWTDGRYFLQAENELDCNWILMKKGIRTTPSIPDWFGAVLHSGDRVGIDPTLVGIIQFKEYERNLLKFGITLVALQRNLIDVIWTNETGRPAMPDGKLLVLGMEYAGETWQDKVNRVRHKMAEVAADAMVVTALDDVAWLFNLRGSDVPYNPVFFAYAVVKTSSIQLFINNFKTKLTQPVKSHLSTTADGGCDGTTECVQIREYRTTLDILSQFNTDASSKKIWISPGSSYAIYNAINETKRFLEFTPVASMKAVKSLTERKGMRNAHLKDAVALIDFLQILEKEVQLGKYWDELKAEVKLEEKRREEKDNMGLSFHTVSAFGPNGAVIHYQSSNTTNRQITTEGMYLLDSGGQYLDGTTDVTRTFHFGTPTSFEKEAYTRVLMGAIDLASTIFPAGLNGRHISGIARHALWRAGLDYRHGTGHGIGMFLNVHEGPASLSSGYRVHDMYIEEGMFFSDEPGYYESGKFGVRLETIVMVKKAETPYHFEGQDYFTFEPISLVPFEKNLIDLKLMTIKQKTWLNNFHKRCLEVVGAELKRRGKLEAHKWLESRTRPVPETYTDSSNRPSASVLPYFIVSMFIMLISSGKF